MNWTKSTFRDRFKWARNQAKKTQQEVADFVKVKRNAISYWEAGKNEAKGQNLELAAEFLNVNAIWLGTGKGDPGFYTPRSAGSYESSRQNTLLYYFNELDDRGKEAVFALAKQQFEWKELAESEQSAETPDDVPDSHKYNSDDPELKLKEGEAQVVGVKKKAVKNAVKKKTARTVKTKK